MAELDQVWGVDRYPASDTFDELVCDMIYVWRDTRGAQIEDNLIMILPHKTEVEVLFSETDHKSNLWYKIMIDGGTGYVRATMLLDHGKDQFDG